MKTTLHSGEASAVSVHDVAAIAVSANARVREDGSVCYWQDLSFFDGEGLPVGTLTLFLARPEERPFRWAINRPTGAWTPVARSRWWTGSPRSDGWALGDGYSPGARFLDA